MLRVRRRHPQPNLRVADELAAPGPSEIRLQGARGLGFFSQLDELGAARTFGLVGTNSEEFAYVGESGAALSRHGAGIENILGLIVFFSHLGRLISAESRHTNGFIFRM